MSKPLSEEQDFLELIRKTLAAVARDTAATAGRPHLLKNSTIQMMRECFTAVSRREHDYRQRRHSPKQTPRYLDDRQSAQPVSLASYDKNKNKNKRP